MLELVYAGTVRPIVGGAVAVGIGIQAIGYLYERDSGLPDRSYVCHRIILQLVGGLLIVVVLGYLIFTLFPSKLVQDGGFVNIFAHGFGFFVGGCIASLLIIENHY